jgi:8-oxo-dGTP diphosphatase
LGAQEQGADATEGRWLVIPRVLCFVLNGDDVLLMKRAPNRRIFPNRYNGVGGHVERDEDPLTAARREIHEETGLEVRELTLRGIHNIDAGESNGILMFVFTATSDTRAFVDHQEEGTLHWVNRDALLSLDLVEDLPLVLPRVLSVQANDLPYFAHVSYDSTDSLRMQVGM